MRSPPPDLRSRVPSDLRIVEAIADNDLRIVAAAEGEGSAKKLATFTGTAYTGGRLMLAGYAYPVVVDLAGMKIPANGTRPILRDHSMGAIVGHTGEIQNSGGSLRIAGVVSGVSPHAQEVVASSGNGFPWQLSIGAKANRMVLVDRGETVEANGRKFTGPLYVARQSTLGEVSFVALGADEGGATARVAASAACDLEVTAMAFEQWLEAKGFRLADLAEAQRGSMQAVYDAEQKGSPDRPADPPGSSIEAGVKTDPDPIADARSRYGAEMKRISDIERICAGTHRDIQARAVSDGWDATRTELEVLRASRPKTSGPVGSAAGDGDHELMAQVDEASLLIATGMPEERAGKFFDQKVMNLAVSKKHRGLTLHGLMDHVLRAAGRDFSGSRKSDEYIQATFRADLDLRADAGITTLSLANILENAAGKTLLAAYQAVEVVWPYITGIRNHTDFKIHSRYRLDATGSFRKVGPDGELKHAGLSDAKYSSQLDTYGTIISLTRQMMINDDLGAFMDIPTALGRLAAIRLEEAVFVLLLSAVNNVFFTAANKNYVTGGTTALAISSLGTVRQKFRDRVDSNGKPILVSPQILLCGTGLETTANNLWAEEKVMVTTTTDKQQFANNPFKGLYRPYPTPYISNTDIRDESGNALANQSSTAWALFADPAVRAAIAVAFLNGSQVPTIQSAETDFNVLGMQWRSFSDFGVGLEDPNAAVWSAGA